MLWGRLDSQKKAFNGDEMRELKKNERQHPMWPTDGLERVNKCPVCGSRRREILYSELTDCVFFCAPGQWTLKQCQECRCAYLDPRPTLDTIHLAYRKYYTHNSVESVPTEGLGLARYFVRKFANGYRNNRYGSEFYPASRLGSLILLLFPGKRQALDRELRYLPKVWPGARILDVGFGNGAFLEKAASAGWQVYGADPDPISIGNARLRGLDVREGGIEAFADCDNSFDIITMSHVIEHLHNPRLVLEQAFTLLKPGGWLYIDTPNIESIGHQKFAENWRGLEVPRHLTIFSFAAIESLLEQIGYNSTKSFHCIKIYPRLAAASHAISECKDPYKSAKITLSDRLKGGLIDFRTRFYFRRREFITLRALKPKRNLFT